MYDILPRKRRDFLSYMGSEPACGISCETIRGEIKALLRSRHWDKISSQVHARKYRDQKTHLKRKNLIVRELTGIFINLINSLI